MNPNTAEVLVKLREHMPILREKYSVKALELFGSFVKSQQKGESDIDILVEFSNPIDLFTFVELEEFLSKVLGRKVDLVMKDTLKPRIKERILKEAIPV
jgi:predicted nucleotidyltransferase